MYPHAHGHRPAARHFRQRHPVRPARGLRLGTRRTALPFILLLFGAPLLLLHGTEAEAITWLEESPGCYNPLDRGGNCTYWRSFKPAQYDQQVRCLAHTTNLDDPRAMCWWNRRIMGYFVSVDGVNRAGSECRAASPTNWCNSLPSNRSPVEGWKARYYRRAGIVYYYLWRRSSCPDGWRMTADGECLRDEEPPDSLNAGSSGCRVMEANPVHVGTGNKYQREVDIASAGPGGIRFIRHYNSRRSYRATVAWTHTYDRSLILRPFSFRRSADEPPEAYRNTIELRRPDGRSLVFYRTGEHELAASDAEIPERVPAVGTDRHPLHWTGNGWRYRNESGELEYFSEDGALERIVDRSGFTQRVEVDAEGRVTSVRDDFGRSLVFEYDRFRAQPARILGPGGDEWIYAYDSDRNLVGVTYPDGSSRSYHYGEFGAPPDYLTGITDENGNRFATWKYDDQGRAVVSEHAGGAERVEIEYRDDGTARVTDASGNERIHSIATVRGLMLSERIENGCISCGDASTREYNDLGLVTRATDRNGNVTTYQYNEHGLEIARTEAAGTSVERTVLTQWDTDLRLPLVVTEPGKRTEYTYDARGRRLSMTETDTAGGRSRTTTWSYHPDRGNVPGRLAAIDGPRTDVDDITRHEYDAQGNRVRTINALGHVTGITAYDAWGRPLSIVDPNGLVTELAYDPRGRLLSRDTGGQLTTFGYDGVGNLTHIDLPDGSALQYEYDAAQRLTAIADGDGNRIEYTLDAAGNRVRQDVRDAGGALVRTGRQVFDELDRLVQVTGAQGQSSTRTYDPNGNRVAATDAAGHATRHTFDALDRLIRVTDALGGVTRYTYDAHDRVVSVTDPNGNTTTYAYDGLGHRVEIDSPDSGVSTYEYDAAGNVTAATDARSQRTEHTHDALNRLLRSEYADGTTVDYGWDEGPHGIGRLTRIEETMPGGDIHRTDWRYDAHGRVTARIQVVDGVTLTTRHAYDAAGRRVETVYPSGRIVTRTYARDELTGLAVDGETVLSDAQYQPFGPVSGWTWGDGDRHTRSFDLDGRLTGHSLGDGSRTIAYTEDDNIASITGPWLDRSYDYDGLDRLVAANDPVRSDTYAYDANGNRTHRNEAGQTETYTIDAASNRLLAVAGRRNASYTYDAAGNLIDDGDHGYTYSARNRLVAIDGGATAVYRYNAVGQRISKRVGGGNVDYAALAAEYQQLADDLAAEAAALQQQADSTRARAGALAEDARQLDQGAQTLRDEAVLHHQEAAALREEAEQLRSEARSLIEQAGQKATQARPLQQEADALLAEAAALLEQAAAERDASEQDRQRADELAASAAARRTEAQALEALADDNERLAAENRSRAPELEAEADRLRLAAGEKEIEAQPHLEEVERLERRIVPMQRTIDRFNARIQRLQDRLVDNPGSWSRHWHNWRIRWRIRIQTWIRDWLQYRLEGWKQEQAEYQQQANALLDEAEQLRQQAEDNDRLARQLREQADRLDAEADDLRRQAEEQRALARQEEADSTDFAHQADAHRDTAGRLEAQAQVKQDDARPLTDQAQRLREEAETLRADADAKLSQAETDEQQAADLDQLATEKRAAADRNEQQTDALNDEARQLQLEADALKAQAEEKLAAANAAQEQANEYAALAENPPPASQMQYFVYNGAGRLIGRYDDNGSAIREYIRFKSIPVAIAENDAVYYVHGDYLGTPRAVSEPNDAIVWSWISDAFGDREPNEDPDGDGETFTLNFRHPGQYYDAESGLHQNWWRSYSPENGDYITPDPLGLDVGPNPYVYANANPVAFADPTGLIVPGPASGPPGAPLPNEGVLPKEPQNGVDPVCWGTCQLERTAICSAVGWGGAGIGALAMGIASIPSGGATAPLIPAASATMGATFGIACNHILPDNCTAECQTCGKPPNG